MCVIAGATFTQLLRMKIFIFLAIFVLILLGITFIRPEYYLGPETFGINSLVLLKSSSFAAIRLFGLIFCIMSTALIIPKDTEDRILYTILCKPVHRIDYLAGKALGVIALAFCAIAIMDVLMTCAVWFRTDTIIAETHKALIASGYSLDDAKIYIDQIMTQGVNWQLQSAVLVLFMECIVLTSMTLLLSCITSGTIISALLAFMVYFIGVFQSQFKLMWFNTGGEGMSQINFILSQAYTLIFPYFGLYSITDSAIEGQIIAPAMLGKLALITIAYFVFQTGLGAWIFRKKEF